MRNVLKIDFLYNLALRLLIIYKLVYSLLHGSTFPQALFSSLSPVSKVNFFFHKSLRKQICDLPFGPLPSSCPRGWRPRNTSSGTARRAKTKSRMASRTRATQPTTMPSTASISSIMSLQAQSVRARTLYARCTPALAAVAKRYSLPALPTISSNLVFAARTPRRESSLSVAGTRSSLETMMQRLGGDREDLKMR